MKPNWILIAVSTVFVVAVFALAVLEGANSAIAPHAEIAAR